MNFKDSAAAIEATNKDSASLLSIDFIRAKKHKNVSPEPVLSIILFPKAGHVIFIDLLALYNAEPLLPEVTTKILHLTFLKKIFDSVSNFSLLLERKFLNSFHLSQLY